MRSRHSTAARRTGESCRGMRPIAFVRLFKPADMRHLICLRSHPLRGALERGCAMLCAKGHHPRTIGGSFRHQRWTPPRPLARRESGNFSQQEICYSSRYRPLCRRRHRRFSPGRPGNGRPSCPRGRLLRDPLERHRRLPDLEHGPALPAGPVLFKV
jgi:hypothetical protein